MKKQEEKSIKQDSYLSIERELHEKNKKILDIDNQKGLAESLESSKNVSTNTIYLVTTTTNITKDNVEGAYLSYEIAEDNQYTLSLGMIPSEIDSIEIPHEMAEKLLKSTYIDIAPLIGDYINEKTKYSYTSD